MTPSEIISARQSLGMTRLEFARALDVGGNDRNAKTEAERWERDPSRKTHTSFPAIKQLKLMKLMEK